jgi:hypothetical protein
VEDLKEGEGGGHELREVISWEASGSAPVVTLPLIANNKIQIIRRGGGRSGKEYSEYIIEPIIRKNLKPLRPEKQEKQGRPPGSAAPSGGPSAWPSRIWSS